MPKIIKTLDNRRQFVNTLNELNDPKVIVLIPDVGFLYLDDPNNKFKVINTGVTEEATMIIAAALALDGWKPYVYSMINFVAFRPFEMVRNGICCHKANVKILGVKGSAAYKFLGFSHNLIYEKEDVNILKKYLPCYIPKNPKEVKKVILSTYKSEKPAYIRL